MTGFNILPLAVALLIGIAALGSCLGIGLVGQKFLESTARQPELVDTLQTKFFLVAGVTDGASSSPPASRCGSPRRIPSAEQGQSRPRKRGAGTRKEHEALAPFVLAPLTPNCLWLKYLAINGLLFPVLHEAVPVRRVTPFSCRRT